MGSGGGPEVMGIIADRLSLREIGAEGEEAGALRNNNSRSWRRDLSSSNSALVTYFSLATATCYQPLASSARDGEAGARTYMGSMMCH